MVVKSKKGVEMTLQTIVMMIIILIVIIVVIMFFVKHNSSSTGIISTVGNTIIKNPGSLS